MKLDAHSLNTLQNFTALLHEAQRDGLSVDQALLAVEDFIAAQIAPSPLEQHRRRRKARRSKPILCPAGCGGHVVLGQVNISPCTNVGGGYKTQVTCPTCKYDGFSRRTIDQIIYMGLED